MRPAAELDVFACPLAGRQLVEASAGTGKTWALCALVLRLLLERRLALPQILVVTFTNAATAELRERVRGRIVETLEVLRGRPLPAPGTGDPFVGDLLARLRAHGTTDAEMVLRLDEALQGFDEASIFTIHGLCQRALADHAFGAGVPLVQELLADDAELRLQVVRDHWRRHVAGDALPPLLAGHLVRRGDTPERWAALLARRQALPLARLRWPDDIDTPLPDAAPLARAWDAAAKAWHDRRNGRDTIVGIVREALPRLPGNVYKPASIDAACAQWDRWLAAGDPLARPKDDKRALFGTRRLQPKKGQAPPAPHPFFDAADALLQAGAAAAQALDAARLRLLRQLLADAPAVLQALKRSQRVLAFDDLLQQLHARLTGADGGALAAALRARHPVALIDEFQDTDPLQVAIFDALYGAGSGGTLFLLGDPKQAIYGFRGADLHTYLQARERVDAAHTLTRNQRSDAALLRALNALFGRRPQAFLQPGLDYHPVQRGSKPHPPLHDASGAARAPLQLWSLPAGADGVARPKRAALQAAADACAAEVARLLAAAGRGELRLGERALAAGDIALLVRSHAQGRLMRRALAARGVASVELSQASVFASAEAADLAQVLAAVLAPAHEGLVRTALATELMGRDAAALAALDADEAAWAAVQAAFVEDRRAWFAHGIAVMLRRWWVREGVAARLLARPDGERRLTNLLHLADLLQQAAFGTAAHGGPEALLRWLQQARLDPRADDAAQLRLESDRALVQIVTIHKSKGLEYPIVFCPFLWDGHAAADRAGDATRWHGDDGATVLDFSGDDQAQVRRAREDAAERLRLTYVALTRAVHRCTVVVGPYRVGRSEKEAGRSALAWLAAGDASAAPSWPESPLAKALIAAGWRALVERAAPDVALAPLPHDAGAVAPPAADAAVPLEALAPPAQLPTAWWIGSYSGLVRAGAADAALPHAAADRDRHLDDGADAEFGNVGDDGDAAGHDVAADILQFPRGPVAGECLHGVFERADFADPASWPAAIDAALRARPPIAGASAAASAGLAPMLQRMLGDVLATPLAGAGRLADVPAARRVAELEFTLPVARLGVDDLAQALQRLGWPVPPLTATTLRGYLRGFIDLVFEQGGRYFVLDWKSNFLGTTAAEHGSAPVAQAVHRHGYQLQALLYTLALHRWLRHRLPAYDYDTHVGGAQVLFVRGVRPSWPGAGVWSARPDAAVVQWLSDRCDGHAEAGA